MNQYLWKVIPWSFFWDIELFLQHFTTQDGIFTERTKTERSFVIMLSIVAVGVLCEFGLVSLVG